MITYKTLLLRFLNEKDAIVRQHTRLRLATADDFKEIEINWAEAQCEKIMKSLHTRSDDACCPWCIITVCDGCGYGRRNGVCIDDPDSRYGRILDRIPEYLPECSITALPGMRNLIEKYINITKRRDRIAKKQKTLQGTFTMVSATQKPDSTPIHQTQIDDC